MPGADLDGVRYLRTLADSDRLPADAGRAAAAGVVVVGGGWIGLEVAAAAARTYGNDVTVVEPQPTPLHAVLGAEMGAGVRAPAPGARRRPAHRHRRAGVPRRRRPVGVRASTDGTRDLPADLVVVGVGAAPEHRLADGGRARGRQRHRRPTRRCARRRPTSSRPATSRRRSTRCYGRHVRVEHWANALNGGPAAARSMLGQDVAYDRVPYFFTDQYDLGMEYSGLGGPDDDRSSSAATPTDGEFIAFWLPDGRVTPA